MHLDSTWPEVERQGAEDLAAFIGQKGLGIRGTDLAETLITRRADEYTRARETRREVTAEASMRWAFAQHGLVAPEATLVARAIDAFFAYEEARWVAYPEALAMLQGLAEQGIRLGMYSNATHDPFIQRLVDRFGFRPWLKPALSSAGTGIRKPDPAAFAPFVANWGLPPHSLLVVGDTLEADILGARLAGMQSIWLRSRSDARQEGPDPGQPDAADSVVPSATIRRIDELQACLQRFQAG
jgi:HAD superfamily hydrolase (TIGR01549 family)